MASGIETTFPMMPVFQHQYAEIKTQIVAKIAAACNRHLITSRGIGHGIMDLLNRVEMPIYK